MMTVMVFQFPSRPLRMLMLCGDFSNDFIEKAYPMNVSWYDHSNTSMDILFNVWMCLNVLLNMSNDSGTPTLGK
jgi:hypothetical protein